MRAISAFSRDPGMSTRVCLAVTALRIRVSISAIGSVITLSLQSTVDNRQSTVSQQVTSPATLRHARDVALERELAEAEAAERELPHVCARAAAQVAAAAQPDLVLRRLVFFCDLCGGCHRVQLSALSSDGAACR